MLGSLAGAPTLLGLRAASTTLVIAAFAIGGLEMFDVNAKRPDYPAPAQAIEAQASTEDVVTRAPSLPDRSPHLT